MCIMDVHKPDVSRFAEQTLRDWWSLAVLKPFRKIYIEGEDASYYFCFFFFLFRRNKVTYIVFRGFFRSIATPQRRPKGLRFMCRPSDLSETKNI